MQPISYAQGEPSWQDQSSPDPAKAAEFYSALFGWDCPEGPAEFSGYRNCTLNGRTVAGIGPQMHPGPAFWSTYFHVDSAEDIAARVSANGGQVLFPPMAVGEMGTMAVFMDPTGAAFGIWQVGIHRGAEIRDEPGAACWYELMTSDLNAAKDFYTAVFGWGMNPGMTSDGSSEYIEFSVGDKHVGGLMAKPPTMPAEVPSYWGVYFQVEDADAALARITELGGTSMMGPMDIQPGRFAVAADPTGAVFNLFEPKR